MIVLSITLILVTVAVCATVLFVRLIEADTDRKSMKLRSMEEEYRKAQEREKMYQELFKNTRFEYDKLIRQLHDGAAESTKKGTKRG